MKKLLELEKELRKAKDDLNKIMSSNTTMSGSVNSTGGSSLASQIGFGKAEKKELVGDQKELDQDKDGDIEADDLAALRAKKKKMKKAEHSDEKEDKKLIAEIMDEHNEKKHGEKKDKDSAFKEMGLKKSDEQLTALANGQWVLEKAMPTKPANPAEGKKQQLVDSVVNQTRQPAKVISASGEETMVSPEEQVKAQKDAAASKKAKFEAEAAERRAQIKQEAKKKMP